MRNKREKAGEMTPKEAEALKKENERQHAEGRQKLAAMRAENPEYLKGVNENTDSHGD